MFVVGKGGGFRCSGALEERNCIWRGVGNEAKAHKIIRTRTVLDETAVSGAKLASPTIGKTPSGFEGLHGCCTALELKRACGVK